MAQTPRYSRAARLHSMRRTKNFKSVCVLVVVQTMYSWVTYLALISSSAMSRIVAIRDNHEAVRCVMDMIIIVIIVGMRIVMRWYLGRV